MITLSAFSVAGTRKWTQASVIDERSEGGKNRGVVRLWLEGFTVTQARSGQFFYQRSAPTGVEELSLLLGNTRRNLQLSCITMETAGNLGPIRIIVMCFLLIRCPWPHEYYQSDLLAVASLVFLKKKTKRNRSPHSADPTLPVHRAFLPAIRAARTLSSW